MTLSVWPGPGAQIQQCLHATSSCCPGLGDHGDSSMLTALLQQCPLSGTGGLSLQEVTRPLGAATQPQAVCGESLKDEQGLSHTGKQRGRRERGGSSGQSCRPHSISQAGSGGSRRHRVEQGRKQGDQESPELEETSRTHTIPLQRGPWRPGDSTCVHEARARRGWDENPGLWLPPWALLTPDSAPPPSGKTRRVKGEKVKVLVARSCPTLWDTMVCSPPGPSVHGILQARILEWGPFSRESYRPRH